VHCSLLKTIDAQSYLLLFLQLIVILAITVLKLFMCAWLAIYILCSKYIYIYILMILHTMLVSCISNHNHLSVIHHMSMRCATDWLIFLFESPIIQTFPVCVNNSALLIIADCLFFYPCVACITHSNCS